MFAVYGGSADRKLPVRDADMSVVELAGCKVDASDLSVEDTGIWLCASGITGTLER